MEGRRTLVSATGPKMFVANMRSQRSGEVSSTIPAAEIPALCTNACGAPTAPSIALGCGGDRGGVGEVQLDTDQPVVALTGSCRLAQQQAAPSRGVRIAATTRHPSR